MMLLLTIIAAFAGTNMDTFSILIALFAQADMETSRKSAVHICVGFLAAFSIIYATSMAVSWLGTQFFPAGYVELIGIFPFILGVWSLLVLIVPGGNNGANQDDNKFPQPQREEYSDIPDDESSYDVHDYCLHTEVAKVTSWIVSSGGDNVAMYAAMLSAHRQLSSKLTIFFVSYLLAFCLLALSYHLIHLPAVHGAVRQYGRYIIPWLWMAIGLNVLHDSILGVQVAHIFS